MTFYFFTFHLSLSTTSFVHFTLFIFVSLVFQLLFDEKTLLFCVKNFFVCCYFVFLFTKYSFSGLLVHVFYFFTSVTHILFFFRKKGERHYLPRMMGKTAPLHKDGGENSTTLEEGEENAATPKRRKEKAAAHQRWMGQQHHSTPHRPKREGAGLGTTSLLLHFFLIKHVYAFYFSFSKRRTTPHPKEEPPKGGGMQTQKEEEKTAPHQRRLRQQKQHRLKGQLQHPERRVDPREAQTRTCGPWP